jgi:hypothetical protein
MEFAPYRGEDRAILQAGGTFRATIGYQLTPSVEIIPHEIHTADVPDTPLLRVYVCCQCASVVWPDLDGYCSWHGCNVMDPPLPDGFHEPE